jgi:hypothetical protein
VALVADAAAAAGLAGLVVADPDLAEARASRALPVVGLHALPDVVALLRARPGVGGSRGARLAALEVP